MLKPQLKLVNCAECEKLLCGKSNTKEEILESKLPVVCGFIKGRPYCSQCLEASLPVTSGGMGSEAELHDMRYHGGLFHRGEW